jgi:hypothetical protein
MSESGLIQEILQSYYRDNIPPTCNHQIIWDDPVIVTLKWTETQGGKVHTSKMIKNPGTWKMPQLKS